MNHKYETKKQLINEPVQERQRTAGLEVSETEGERSRSTEKQVSKLSYTIEQSSINVSLQTHMARSNKQTPNFRT